MNSEPSDPLNKQASQRCIIPKPTRYKNEWAVDILIFVSVSIPAKIQTCCCLIPRGRLQDRMRELIVWIQQQQVAIFGGDGYP